MKVAGLVVVVASASASAYAGSWHAGDYVLEGTAGLEVHRGARHAPLIANGTVGTVYVDSQAKRVDVTVETCAGTHDEHFTFDQLEARLVNFDALVRHRAKDWKAAARGFAVAAALDPSWRLPAYNLASANARLGDKSAAVAALAPWLAAEPVATYAHAATDPDLQPLLATKELGAVRATAPGTSKLERPFHLQVAYSPEHRVAAAILDHSGTGECARDLTLAMYDAAGNQIAELQLITPADIDGLDCRSPSRAQQAQLDARIGKRLDALDALLASLGFSPATIEQAHLDINADLPKATLDHGKLGLVGGKDNRLHVLRGDTLVGSVAFGEDVTYLPDAKLIFTHWSGHNEVGCPTEHDAVAPVFP